MFDGLRETLGSFREDAEEAAEENVEELDEEEINEEEIDEEEIDEEELDGEADLDPEDVDESDDVSGGDDVDGAADASVPEATDGESDSEAEVEEAEASDAEPEETDADSEESTVDSDEDDAESAVDEAESGEDDADSDGDDEPNTGFARKAKNLARGKFVIEAEDLEGPLQDLEMALLASDVEIDVANALLDNIRDELVGETRTVTTSTGAVVEEALESALLDVISVGQFDFEERIQSADKPVVLVFTGVNGVGKTTSIAKLSEYLEERGLSSVMANGDTFRAGANEQIREHANRLDRKLIAHEQGGDPAAVIYDAVEYAEANDVDVVLGDTAGRLHTSEGLMDQLAKIDRVVEPDMTLFVDESVAGQDAVKRAREFDDAASIDGTILTKADADSGGGAAISIAYVTGKPILFLGTGQGYDDLERFDPEWVVDQLLGE